MYDTIIGRKPEKGIDGYFQGMRNIDYSNSFETTSSDTEKHRLRQIYMQG